MSKPIQHHAIAFKPAEWQPSNPWSWSLIKCIGAGAPLPPIPARDYVCSGLLPLQIGVDARTWETDEGL